MHVHLAKNPPVKGILPAHPVDSPSPSKYKSKFTQYRRPTKKKSVQKETLLIYKDKQKIVFRNAVALQDRANPKMVNARVNTRYQGGVVYRLCYLCLVGGFWNGGVVTILGEVSTS